MCFKPSGNTGARGFGLVFQEAAGIAVPGSARPPWEVYFSKVLPLRSRSPALHIFLAPPSFWSFPVEETIPVEYRGWEFSAFWVGSAHLH